MYLAREENRVLREAEFMGAPLLWVTSIRNLANFMGSSQTGVSLSSQNSAPSASAAVLIVSLKVFTAYFVDLLVFEDCFDLE